MQSAYHVIFGGRITASTSAVRNEDTDQRRPSWILRLYITCREGVLLVGFCLAAVGLIFPQLLWAQLLSGISPLIDLQSATTGSDRSRTILMLSARVRLIYAIGQACCLITSFTAKRQTKHYPQESGDAIRYSQRMLTEYVADKPLLRSCVALTHQIVLCEAVAVQLVGWIIETIKYGSPYGWWYAPAKMAAILVHSISSYTFFFTVLYGSLIIVTLVSKLQSALRMIKRQAKYLNHVTSHPSLQRTEKHAMRSVIVIRLVRYLYTVQTVSHHVVGVILLLHTMQVTASMALVIYIVTNIKHYTMTLPFILTFIAGILCTVPSVGSIGCGTALYRHTTHTVTEICSFLLVKGRKSRDIVMSIRLACIRESITGEAKGVKLKIGFHCALVGFTVTPQYSLNVRLIIC